MHRWQIDYVEQEKIRDEKSLGLRVPLYIWRDLESGYETLTAPTAADALTMWRANSEMADVRRYAERTARETPKRKRFVRIQVVVPDGATTG